MQVNKIKVSEVKELIDIADFERNADEEIDVVNLYVNSSVLANWKCKNGHYFKEKVNVIYRRKYKCFYCTGRQIWSGENDLQTLYPDLAKEFDVKLNGITPDKISPRDTKTYWWTCKEGHPSFTRTVEHRVNRESECPYCAGRLAIPGETDLKTLYPEIAEEWDEEKNGVLPDDLNPFSYNSYYWICPKGHSYKKKVVKRTKYHKPVDCTKCAKAQTTSFPEQAIYYYAKKCFPDAVNRYREPFEKGMELDIFIPFWNIGIEYDGAAFHKDEEQHEREHRKYTACQKLGIRLIRIKEGEDTWKDTADEIFYVKKRMKDDDMQAFLCFMFGKVFALKKYTYSSDNKEKALLNCFYGFPTDFNVSRDRPEILEYLVDIEHSFGARYPHLAELWDEEANGKLTPFMLPPGSNHEVTWKCPICKKSWKAPVGGIVSRNVKTCKACSMKRNGINSSKRTVLRDGSLADNSEKLFKQWDYEGNGNLTPYDVPLGYSKKVAWKCDVCGYKWSSSPNSRLRNGQISDCPHCTGRVAMAGVDVFETLFPDIA